MSNLQSTVTTGKRDDITLLVRNFNFPLPHALKSPTNQSVRFNPIVESVPIITMPENDYSSIGITEENSDLSTTETSSTSDIYPDAKSTNKNTRIKSYVNFSEYYENVEKRRREGTLPEGINF